MDGTAGQIVFGVTADINQTQVDSVGVLFIDNGGANATLKVKQSDGVVLTARTIATNDPIDFSL